MTPLSFELTDNVTVTGADPVLPSRLHIGEAAAQSLAWIGQGIASLGAPCDTPPEVETSATDGARSIISFGLQRIDGQPIARSNQSNPLVRLYQAGDGRWVFIHGGFPGLAAGLIDLLELDSGADLDFATVGDAVGAWDAQALEDAAAERGLCCVMARTAAEWLSHPHGAVLAQEPLVRIQDRGELGGWEPASGGQPLAGLRVLDFTRVLAGPTCGRTLTAYGADVLQVSAADVPRVEAFVIDTGHGKRRTLLDLTQPDELARVRELALEADVVVQGNRPGMMSRFGLDEESLRSADWAGSYVSISCFGETGPFAQRPGWEQLAQATTGLAYAEAGINRGDEVGADVKPVMVPAAANDYTTGLLMAGGLLDCLARGRAARVDASLCHTAMWIERFGTDLDPSAATGVGEPEMLTYPSGFGELQVAPLGVRVDGVSPRWAWGSRQFATAPGIDGEAGWTEPSA